MIDALSFFGLPKGKISKKPLAVLTLEKNETKIIVKVIYAFSGD